MKLEDHLLFDNHAHKSKKKPNPVPKDVWQSMNDNIPTNGTLQRLGTFDLSHLVRKVKKFCNIGGLKTVIHINQHIIKSNRKHGRTDPVITAKNSRGNFYGHTVKVTGECEVVYRPDKPLSCGAHVWIQTTGTVEVDGKAINKKERD